MKRRTLIKRGLVAVTAVTAGCKGPSNSTRTPTATGATPSPSDEPDRSTQTPSASPPHAERFGTVIDAVEAGAGLAGGRPLNRVLEDVAGDDTMVYLPEGRYRMDDYWRFKSFSNFGIVGDSATIVPPDGYTGSFFGLGTPGGASDLLFEGITFDFRAPETGGRPINVKIDDGLEVRDVTVTGTLDSEETMMRFDVTSESGRGLIERMRLPDGAVPTSNAYGCLVGETNRGDIDFVDCEIVGFPNNGLYAEPPAGVMRVMGGFYANNEVANVRINNGVVRRVHVRCDAAPPEFGNMRGIRLNKGNDVLVEGCTIEFLDVTASDGAIVSSQTMDGATIRNTRIRIDTDNVSAILGKPPTEATDVALRCENVCIEGAAANASAIQVEQREGSTFDGVSIHQTGSNRDGITLVDSDDSVVKNSHICVTGNPLVHTGSEIRRENVEILDGSCRKTGCSRYGNSS